MEHDEGISQDLKTLEDALTKVAGAILQTSNRTAATIVGVAASKLVAAGVAAGAMGAIGAFGVASTGTAIAALSGAAATSATFYWIGSTVGLGAVAGGTILTAGALVIGFPAAVIAKRRLFGKARSALALPPEEQAVLYAALRLATAARIAEGDPTSITAIEKKLTADIGMMPLVSDLRNTYLRTTQENDECASRPASLAVLPKRRLRSAIEKLDRLAMKWSAS